MNQYFAHNHEGQIVLITEEFHDLSTLNERLAAIELQMTDMVNQRMDLINLIEKYNTLAPAPVAETVAEPAPAVAELGGAADLQPVTLEITPGVSNA